MSARFPDFFASSSPASADSNAWYASASSFGTAADVPVPDFVGGTLWPAVALGEVPVPGRVVPVPPVLGVSTGTALRNAVSRVSPTPTLPAYQTNTQFNCGYCDDVDCP